MITEEQFENYKKRLKEEIPKECSFIPDEGKYGVVNVWDVIDNLSIKEGLK